MAGLVWSDGHPDRCGKPRRRMFDDDGFGPAIATLRGWYKG